MRPVAPYIGGKRNLSQRLVALIETIPHRTYAEPFVGMGGVFLRRRSRPTKEVINDRSEEVFNFYRMLQEHYVFFMEMLRFQVTSRAQFDRLLKVDPRTLTELQRAARFLYLQRLAFGGKVVGRGYGVAPATAVRFDVTRLRSMLEDLHERLAGVEIECLDWSAFLGRYDRADTLFYLDPPYFGCEGDYGADLFDQAQFARMAEQLGGIAGRFVLSINDQPQIREIFGRFNIEAVGVTYQVSGKPTAAKELIITNG